VSRKAICGFTFSRGLLCQLPRGHKSKSHKWEDETLTVTFRPWGPRDLTRKRKETLSERVFEFVAERRWRSEDTVVNAFPSVGRPAVEDALFALVTAGRLAWFGAEGCCDKPMRYRVVKPDAGIQARR
jgi:hypothetical protein